MDERAVEVKLDGFSDLRHVEFQGRTEQLVFIRVAEWCGTNQDYVIIRSLSFDVSSHMDELDCSVHVIYERVSWPKPQPV